MSRTRAIRGATTVDRDEPDQIRERVGELMTAIVARNPIDGDDLISVIVTATTDIGSMYPATAVREAGFSELPLIGASELEVEGGTPRCIRVMVHVHTAVPAAELEHVYLHGAANLRSDLAGR